MLATTLKIAAMFWAGLASVLVLPVFVTAFILLTLLCWFDQTAQVVRRFARRR